MTYQCGPRTAKRCKSTHDASRMGGWQRLAACCAAGCAGTARSAVYSHSGEEVHRELANSRRELGLVQGAPRGKQLHLWLSRIAAGIGSIFEENRVAPGRSLSGLREPS